jgi:hypothetical protein
MASVSMELVSARRVGEEWIVLNRTMKLFNVSLIAPRMAFSIWIHKHVHVNPVGLARIVLKVSFLLDISYISNGFLIGYDVSFIELCDTNCGLNGVCIGGGCQCSEGWAGTLCNQRLCDKR